MLEETFKITPVIEGCDDRTYIGLELTQSELDFESTPESAEVEI